MLSWYHTVLKRQYKTTGKSLDIYQKKIASFYAHIHHQQYMYFKSKRRRQRKSVLCDVFDIVMKQCLEYFDKI